MSKLKIPAAFLVIGAMLLGVPAIAAPVIPLSAAAKPMAQESELVQVRWHGGWRRWQRLAWWTLSLPSLLSLGRLGREVALHFGPVEAVATCPLL